MIKKAYSKPSLDITEFKAEDIIRTSGGTEPATVSLDSDFRKWGTTDGFQVVITK